MADTKIEPRQIVTQITVSTRATVLGTTRPEQKTIITPTKDAVIVVEGGRGPQGPAGVPGPQGPAGASGGTTVVKVAAQALGGHRAVRTVNATDVDYCDADTLAHRDSLLGMTTGAASAGAAATVQTTGEIDEPSWSWTPGLPVFCGPLGVLTQTYSAAWKFSRIIGWAQSATRIWLAPREPITL